METKLINPIINLKELFKGVQDEGDEKIIGKQNIQNIVIERTSTVIIDVDYNDMSGYNYFISNNKIYNILDAISINYNNISGSIITIDNDTNIINKDNYRPIFNYTTLFS